MRHSFRAVIHCYDVLFCKVLSDEYELPEIGKKYDISLFPGQGWDVETLSKIEGSEHDITTWFFKSENPELFECLCSCLTPEKGWREANHADMYMIRAAGLGII